MALDHTREMCHKGLTVGMKPATKGHKMFKVKSILDATRSRVIGYRVEKVFMGKIPSCEDARIAAQCLADMLNENEKPIDALADKWWPKY